ncbi:related to stress response protein rds1p [Melanopsichium pennsylvanicum]|uniref:Related to stress response protein rds1p n=2 Tax=Melanopsichium pennsylvanicum TaxID=63383 RepID=A0AAJ4XPW8_9BASI|nr:related to stress response protein rds1p [Melanopsichium pennsylvanicum 4]SNX86615.1 related to stress response protein rds1p [Melanopsichium pennsylvanicum]
MLTKYAILAATAAAAVTAAPALVQKRAAAGQADIDTVILNYALTLEHLENAFYHDSLATYDAEAFRSAGYPDWVRQRFIEIGGHEKAHVDFLTKVLGDAATKECTYDFGVTDVKTFIATSQLLEGVGESAYLGAAQNITAPGTLTAAGSILTVESRHAGWVSSSVLKGDGFPRETSTPLNFNQTYSLAAPLIKSCPDTNPALPVKAFPAATVSGEFGAGKTITVSGDGVQSGQYAAFLAGLQVLYAPIGDGNTVTVPEGVGYGRIYLIVSKVNNSIADDNVVAGPAVIQAPLSPSKAAQIYSQ